MKKIAIALTILLAVTACSKVKTAQTAAAPAASATATVPSAVVVPAAQSAAPVASANVVTGKVRETLNAGGYTYLRIATSAGDQWAAVGEAKVAKGDMVSVDGQMTMEDFESKTLKRTFDRIVFGTLAGNAARPAVAASAPAIPPQMTSALSAAASQHMQSPAVADLRIEKAAGGKTVAEVWAEKSALAGREVVVRGKVVKFLPGIMGTNWMHIRDGTGSGANGDNDLTVTTNEKVTVGEVVTVKGTLAADKDFGAGYHYAVIVENTRRQ